MSEAHHSAPETAGDGRETRPPTGGLQWPRHGPSTALMPHVLPGKSHPCFVLTVLVAHVRYCCARRRVPVGWCVGWAATRPPTGHRHGLTHIKVECMSPPPCRAATPHALTLSHPHPTVTGCVVCVCEMCSHTTTCLLPVLVRSCKGRGSVAVSWAQSCRLDHDRLAVAGSREGVMRAGTEITGRDE